MNKFDTDRDHKNNSQPKQAAADEYQKIKDKPVFFIAKDGTYYQLYIPPRSRISTLDHIV